MKPREKETKKILLQIFTPCLDSQFLNIIFDYQLYINIIACPYNLIQNLPTDA